MTATPTIETSIPINIILLEVFSFVYLSKMTIVMKKESN